MLVEDNREPQDHKINIEILFIFDQISAEIWINIEVFMEAKYIMY